MKYYVFTLSFFFPYYKKKGFNSSAQLFILRRYHSCFLLSVIYLYLQFERPGLEVELPRLLLPGGQAVGGWGRHGRRSRTLSRSFRAQLKVIDRMKQGWSKLVLWPYNIVTNILVYLRNVYIQKIKIQLLKDQLDPCFSNALFSSRFVKK